MKLISASLVALLFATGFASAQTNPYYLGKLARGSSDAYSILGGFHHSSVFLRHFGKPELLFIGTYLDDLGPGTPNIRDNLSAAERWPVVKALQQFGSFSGLRPVERRCYMTRFLSNPEQQVCSTPTFDWLRSSYRSSYLAFVHKDLLDWRGKKLQTMSPQERSLYYRYARNPSSPKLPGDLPDRVLATVGIANGECFRTQVCPSIHQKEAASRALPLVAVGNYLQTQLDVLHAGWDFEGYAAGSNTESAFPFSAVQSALARAADPPGSSLVEDANGATNIIVGLICHVTGNKPKSVCGQSYIHSIERHVK